MRSTADVKNALFVLFAVLLGLGSPASAAPVLRVDARAEIGPATPYATGVNHVFSTATGGVPANWDATTGRPNSPVAAQTLAANVPLVRFPGGIEGARYDWKAGVGLRRAGCQFSGRGTGVPAQSNVYGFDEHLRFAAEAGAEAVVMVPFAFSTAQEAADWVEYANAPLDASNPGGGIDWALVRAANGHPEPYGITRWEIGNEPYRSNQRYWMSENARRARAQYATGGFHAAFNETADADCTWGPRTDGLGGQRYQTRFAPLKADGFELTVGEAVWTRVADLSTAAPTATVYTLDQATGAIGFGDGVHGRIPPGGARVGVTYKTQRLPGYDDFRRAMRAIDPTIDVCATWADAGFLRAARREARSVDCLSAHPYTQLSDFGSVLYNAAHYDAAMKGAARAAAWMKRLAARMKGVPGEPYLAASEYGALSGGAMLESGAAGSMIHAMYMATEQFAWLRQGLPWALGGRLVDSPFAILSGGGGLTPAGEMLRPFGDLTGSRMLRATVSGNPRTHGYAALKVIAARTAAGRLSLLILNRDRKRPRALRLDINGFTTSGQGEQAQATSAAFDSALAAYTDRPVSVKDQARLKLPAHSFTRLDLDPAG